MLPETIEQKKKKRYYPNRHICSKLCDNFRNMLNIREIGKVVGNYFLIDYCTVCRVSYPKYCLLKCPCCNKRLRTNRLQVKWHDDSKPKRFLLKNDREKAEYVREQMKKGWTLFKTDQLRRGFFEILLAKQEVIYNKTTEKEEEDLLKQMIEEYYYE